LIVVSYQLKSILGILMMCIRLQTLNHLGQLKTVVYNGATNDPYKQTVFGSLGALASCLFCSRGALFSI